MSDEFDDLDSLQDPGSVYAQLNAPGPVWPYEHPVPVGPTQQPRPFPAQVLPGWAATFVQALAEATQTPTCLGGCCVLGVLAACCGGRAVVEARPGWREPTNLYLLPVMPPGSRKSAVIAAATAPLHMVERDLVDKVRDQIAETITQKEVAEAAAAKALQAAARARPHEQKDKTADAVSAAALAAAIEVPPVPRLVADDITPEAAVSLLAEQRGRLAILSAEGGIFDVIAGRYSSGMANLDVWLKGHSGDHLRVDRKGRPPEHIDHPALTMLLTVQPHVIASIAGNASFRGRGLLARELYSIPADHVGRRKVGADPVPEDVTTTYINKVMHLADTMFGWTDPAILQLTPEAHELLIETEQTIEPQLAPDGALGDMREWGSKLAGAILRIAGLLHLAADVEAVRRPITRETLADAVRLGGYFTEHAKAAFDVMGADPGLNSARKVLAYLRRHGIEQFKPSELTKAHVGGRDEVHKALTVLVDHGWLLEIPEPPRDGPGRPAPPTYYTHGDLFA